MLVESGYKTDAWPDLQSRPIGLSAQIFLQVRMKLIIFSVFFPQRKHMLGELSAGLIGSGSNGTLTNSDPATKGVRVGSLQCPTW